MSDMKATKSYLPLIALCVGFFMVVLDVTIINVALPTIARDLHGNIADLQWIVAGYALTFACLLLTAGSLGDQFGAKQTFILGLLLFVLTSLGCALAPSLAVLIVSRLLQGIGAAMLVPTSLALINGSYEDPRDRARAIGIWGGVSGIAAASGPILGAVLVAAFGWRAIFLVNIPVGLLGVYLTVRYVLVDLPPRSDVEQRFDWTGQVCSIVCIAALAFSLIEGGRLGWHSPMVLISFFICVVTFALFLSVERRISAPMFPLHFFRIKTFCTAILVGMILNISFYGELFLLPLYFQNIRGYSVLETGFALLPMLGIVAISSYYSGRVVGRMSYKMPMIVGLLVGAIGFLSLLVLKVHAPPYVVLIMPLMALGFGISFTMPAATVCAISSVPKNYAGLASGALNTSRQVGSLLGVAIFGAMVAVQPFMVGIHITLILSAIAFLVGCFLVINTKMCN